MYDFNSGLDAYQETTNEAQAATADPHKLVVMLIEGFLDELERAQGHIQAQRFEHKGRSISKCMDILAGLDSALDVEQGGEVADNLHNLYEFCALTLYKVSISNETEQLASVFTVMDNLKQGWQQMGRDAA